MTIERAIRIIANGFIVAAILGCDVWWVKCVLAAMFLTSILKSIKEDYGEDR